MDKLPSKSPFPECVSGDIPVVVKFGAAYCPPCRQLDPLITDLAAEYAGRIRVVSVNIEDEPDVAQQFGVRSVPTLLAFKTGRVVEQQVGYSTRRRVEAMFAQLAVG